MIPPQRGLARERAWLRQNLSQKYDAGVNAVTRVLSQSPGLRGGSAEASAELLTDLVAVRLYLTGPAQELDQAVRTGEVGPHVPFGRCVASGLRRMPSYRGPARLCAVLSEAEARWYASHPLITEWAFCPAVTDGRLRLPGTVEFALWSTTARQVSLLEPSLPGQVVFLPGTSFKVLGIETGERPAVLLRELSAAEIGADGQLRDRRAEHGRTSFDDVALAGLEKARAAWAPAGRGEELPAGYAGRFASPPGLLACAGPGRQGDLAAGRPHGTVADLEEGSDR